MEEKNIFPNHISDKGLIPRLYKKLPQLRNNNTDTHTKKTDFKMGKIFQ